jgi:hypothetical protein
MGQKVVKIICQILLLPRHEDAGAKVVGRLVVDGKATYPNVDIMNFRGKWIAK